MEKRILLLAWLFTRLLGANAQPGALDLTFNPGSGITGPGMAVTAIAQQANGQIIIAGTFTAYNGYALNNIARLNTDGSLDTTFNYPGTGTSGTIYTLAVQANGKIIIGGGFQFYDGYSVNSIARLNTDGSLDTSFYIGAGANNVVNAIVIQNDGKIIGGGLFTSFNGVTVGDLVRLDTSGIIDGGFNVTTGANGRVIAAAIQPADSKIIIGGSFTSYDGTPMIRVARVDTDGSLDGSFNALSLGASNNVRTIAVQTNGEIIIGGDFVNYNTGPVNHIVRLETDGGADANFVTNPPGTDQPVEAICIQNNGMVLIGGVFLLYNGDTVNYLTRIEPVHGLIDATFVTGTGPNAQINAMTLQPDGKILIGGTFTSYNGVSRSGIARLNNCTTPQPGPITGDTLIGCPGTMLTYSINPVTGADSYIWTLPAGWTGSSDSTSITVTAGDTTGVISVIAFGDSCGNSAPQKLTVQIIPPPLVPVCEVTVDSQSRYNIVIWDKPATNTIDSFFIYRQDSTYIFTKIASVPYDSLSEYDDTAAAADPNATAHQYKISVLDTCGVESALSDYHSTIFLQDLGNGNLLWAPYEIENAPNPVIYYRVYRDTLGNGEFVPLNTSIPGGNTSYTDVEAAQYPNTDYVLDVNWNMSCSPTRAVNTSRSNIKHTTKSLNGITQVLTDGDFILYPNPAAQTVVLRYPVWAKAVSVDIENVLGEKVYAANIAGGNNNQTIAINIAGLAKGVYMVALSTSAGRVMKKLVVE